MSDSGIDRLSGKIIGLGAADVALAFVFGLSYRLWFLTPSAGGFAAMIVAALAWLAVSGLTVFFVKSMRVAAGITILSAAAMWAFLPEPFSVWSVASIVFLGVCAGVGKERGRAEIANAVKIRFIHTAERVAPILATGLIFFVTFSFLGAFAGSGAAAPKAIFGFALKNADPLTVKFIPDFSSEESFDEALHKIIAARAPENSSAAVINRDAKKLKNEIEKTSGGMIEGSKNFSDVVYELSIAKLLSFPSGARAFAFVILGLSLFGAIKGIAFFAAWIVVGLMFLFFELLRVTNFFHIESETMSRESVVVE